MFTPFLLNKSTDIQFLSPPFNVLLRELITKYNPKGAFCQHHKIIFLLLIFVYVCGQYEVEEVRK